MQFTDTHCHIHEASSLTKASEDKGDKFVRDKWAKGGFNDPTVLIKNAQQVGVSRLICVGCSLDDSQLAVDLVRNQPACWASIGIHPHEAKDHLGHAKQSAFAKLATAPRVVAIGECGLDYYYNHSTKTDQEKVLRFQLDLATEHNLPLIFHVRDAFDDFWPIFDEYTGLKGVIHSFASGARDLEQVMSRGLYVGLNGIMTFTKDQNQLAAAKAVPLDRLLLETDAPFLTPTPYRGTICQPKHVVQVAEFLECLRDNGESLSEIAEATTANAISFFGIE